MTATAERARKRLAHELTGHGWLTEAWQPAFAAVPRHLFLPRFFRQAPDHSRYEAVDANDPGALELIYSDRVLPTQIDGDDARWDESRRHGPIDGVPTCSSTQPALMAVMLDALDVTDGHRVLEVGTGTGYNAALLAHRLGSPLVTTVDIDAGLVRRARRSLAAVGYAPTVAVTDGAAGHPDNAPYDRIIAACSVPQVPAGWLAQTRPGGVILTSLPGAVACPPGRFVGVPRHLHPHGGTGRTASAVDRGGGPLQPVDRARQAQPPTHRCDYHPRRATSHAAGLAQRPRRDHRLTGSASGAG